MGKRERRRQRESQTRPNRGRPSLGAPGPYMVCAVCNEPLNLFSRVAEPEDIPVGYFHNGDIIGPGGVLLATESDHIPVPVEGTPLSADITCDFCHAPSPRFVFVPGKPIRMPNPVTADELDYSSPWACCNDCLPAVKSRSTQRMLKRAVTSPHSMLAGMPAAERQAFTVPLRRFYRAYVDSNPAGPYEIKIRPDCGPTASHRGG